MSVNTFLGACCLPIVWMWFERFGNPDVERLLTLHEFLFTFVFCILTYDTWFYHSHRFEKGLL